jgi:hypothetical protein
MIVFGLESSSRDVDNSHVSKTKGVHSGCQLRYAFLIQMA